MLRAVGTCAGSSDATLSRLVAVDSGSWICHELVCDPDVVVAVLAACGELPASQAAEGESSNTLSERFAKGIFVVFGMVEPETRLLQVLQLPGFAAAVANLYDRQNCFRDSCSSRLMRHPTRTR